MNVPRTVTVRLIMENSVLIKNVYNNLLRLSIFGSITAMANNKCIIKDTAGGYRYGKTQ